MQLNPQQVQELIQIISTNQLTTIGREFGLDYLTQLDKQILFNNGVDVDNLYNEYNDTIFTAFELGMLADSLKEHALNPSYNDLREYISSGKYLPITAKESAIINNIKSAAFGSCKTLQGKIFNDFNNILVNKDAEIKFLEEELKSGVLEKKSLREISNTISRKVGDWSRDFDRIIQYASHTATEHGKAAVLEDTWGVDVLVYKKVFEKACKHCVRLYLTAGPGSVPKIFKLNELRANGTNIGRKVDDWKPVLDATHPYCRCSLHRLPSSSTWNKDKQSYDFDKEKQPKRKRAPIKVWIGGKEMMV